MRGEEEDAVKDLPCAPRRVVIIRLKRLITIIETQVIPKLV